MINNNNNNKRVLTNFRHPSVATFLFPLEIQHRIVNILWWPMKQLSSFVGSLLNHIKCSYYMFILPKKKNPLENKNNLKQQMLFGETVSQSVLGVQTKRRFPTMGSPDSPATKLTFQVYFLDRPRWNIFSFRVSLQNLWKCSYCYLG